jgi:hypothetical protein
MSLEYYHSVGLGTCLPSCSLLYKGKSGGFGLLSINQFPRIPHSTGKLFPY